MIYSDTINRVDNVLKNMRNLSHINNGLGHHYMDFGCIWINSFFFVTLNSLIISLFDKYLSYKNLYIS